MPAAATLKAKTAAAHRRAEVSLDAIAMREGNYSLVAYRQLSLANYATWRAAADWLDEYFEPALIQEDRDFVSRQLKALEVDIKLLSVSPSLIPPLSFTGNGRAELLGLLYVLRGSTLGGTMIARILPTSPELTNLAAFNFYRACGSQPPGHWKAFQAILNETLKEESEQEKAVAAANSVFDYLHDRMNGR